MNPPTNPTQANLAQAQTLPQIIAQTRTMGENLKSIVQLLKPFKGESAYLEYFINSIDEFFHTYYTGENAQKEYVVTAIKSKLIEDAGNFLMSRPDLKTWPDIRAALRIKYGDPYSRQNLIQELMYTSKNFKENIFDYLERLKVLVHRITSKIMSDPDLAAVSHVLVAQNEITAVQNLIINSPVELRTILMIRNPETLDDATTFVLNYHLAESHMKFSTNMNKTHQANNHNQSNNQKPSFKPNTTFQTNKPNNYQQPFFNKSQFPSQPINIQAKPNYQQKFPSSSGTFGKNFSKQHNVFAKNQPNQQFPRPTPMSGVSIQRKQTSQMYRPQQNRPGPSQNYFRPNPNAGPPRYTIEEINNILEQNSEETSEQYFENQEFDYTDYSGNQDEQSNNDYNPDYETQETFSEENFPLTASEQDNQP